MRAGSRLFVTMLAGLAGCAVPQPGSPRAQSSELAARTPGTPERCVPIRSGAGLRVAEGDRDTLLYGSGNTIWANHLGASCRFRLGDIPVIEATGSSYCRGDLVRVVDAASGIPGPACVLGDFVPYTR